VVCKAAKNVGLASENGGETMAKWRPAVMKESKKAALYRENRENGVSAAAKYQLAWRLAAA